jgi:CO dehydrogenase/acetyl-CoA synthase gamma subunit (corrinoid Fe-S protein)
MLRVDLYFKRIDVARYLPRPVAECRDCNTAGCRSFVSRLERGDLAAEARAGEVSADGCPMLTPDRLHAFRIALAPETLLPEVEISQLPRPVEPGVVSTGSPTADAPILVTANNEGTVAVMTALLSLSSSPFRLVVADTRGDSVDMAMILGSLTADRILTTLDTPELRNSPTPQLLNSPTPELPNPSTPELLDSSTPHLILPGFAAPLAREISSRSPWRPVVGPICAAELPLFLGERWRRA